MDKIFNWKNLLRILPILILFAFLFGYFKDPTIYKEILGYDWEEVILYNNLNHAFEQLSGILYPGVWLDGLIDIISEFTDNSWFLVCILDICVYEVVLSILFFIPDLFKNIMEIFKK